jgi:hypothetical protein
VPAALPSVDSGSAVRTSGAGQGGAKNATKENKKVMMKKICLQDT